MSINWVMLKQNGDIEPLEGETVLLRTPGNVSLELKVPDGLRTSHANYSVKCNDGVAYVTTQRMIYLAANPTATFQSFSAFILDTYDPQPRSGGWAGFGAWRWKIEARPRPGGGIPADIPRVEALMIFNNGGMSEFHSKYGVMYERLLHARDVMRETGARVTVHDDDLPAYTPVAAGASVPTASAPVEPSPASAENVALQPQLTPNEPPPGYDEAQAQAVEQQFDEREQQQALRDQ
ncbi:unnamed protein product [Discula destructiva]